MARRARIASRSPPAGASAAAIDSSLGASSDSGAVSCEPDPPPDASDPRPDPPHPITVNARHAPTIATRQDALWGMLIDYLLGHPVTLNASRIDGRAIGNSITCSARNLARTASTV